MVEPLPSHPAPCSGPRVFGHFLSRLAALRGWRAHAAAAGLGVLSAAALPPVHAIPVLLIAVPGLLALLGAQARLRGAALIGFWFGFGHHLVGLYWITEAILVEAATFWWLVPFAVPALAAVLAVFIAVPCAAARAVPAGGRRVLVLAGTWVLADLARQFVATGFPWNLWGSVWAVPGVFGDLFIQPAAWVSVHGLTLATVLLAATPMLGRRAMAAGVLGLAVWAGFGAWHLRLPTSPPPGLTVLLVQGDIAEGAKMDQALATQIFTRYLDLTHEAVAGTSGRRVVIWPEAASPFLLATDANARADIMAADQGVPALIGSLRFGSDGRPRNSMMAILNAGPAAAIPVGAIYDKWHLVPMGEYQPDWLPLPIQLVPGGGFAPGPGPRTLHVPGLPAIGPLICYEAIFPGEVVDEADRPAWMVNITNDAWFGNSSGPRQHLAAARMRAVEEGMPLVRAANTGISAAFDAFGHEQGRIGMNRPGFLAVRLPGFLPPTPFSRFGLAIPALLAVLAVVAGLLRPRDRLRRIYEK
jgi:apolipoprotein N-acyltransferase